MIVILTGIVAAGCGAGKASVTATKKYAPAQLQRDYRVYRQILEDHHPGLYWYTSPDSMNYYFDAGEQQLKDSLTEPSFRKLLNYVTAKINCGHTSVRSSKAWGKYMDTVRLAKMFPLSVKVWPDTMVVTANLNRRDSLLVRGTVIRKINGLPVAEIVDSLFQFLSTDGYNLTHKYQTLSNRGFFGTLFTSVYGLFPNYNIEFSDSLGRIRNATVPVYDPARDTVGRRALRSIRPVPQPSKKERRQQALNNTRLLKIDTLNRTAMMDLASFGRGFGLPQFFKNSFRALRKNKIDHLIIDVRSNGGGSVNNSTILTRYLATDAFKISDSLYAIRKKSRYDRYIQHHFWNRLFIFFFTSKKKDGLYHFRYFEKHYFKPKKKNHFDGKVYVLVGGNSFSATTLFASALVRQDNVTLVGEETGGGAYGNSAWLIPDVTLPETGVRFRLPIFRLVIDRDIPKTGLGVQPEVFSVPTVEAIRNSRDFKVEKALELIQKDKEKKN